MRRRYRPVSCHACPSTSAGTIPLGDDVKLPLTGLNTGSSSKIDGVQTTTFETGSHRAGFATTRVTEDATVVALARSGLIAADAVVVSRRRLTSRDG